MRDLYIDVSHEVLEDLKVRLRGARFPVVLDEQENNAGISVEFMKNLVDYWLTEYDWAAHQKILNSYRHGIYTIQGKELHALHEQSPQNLGTVLLIHGWPDSFLRYIPVIHPLVEAGYNVVVPSLPGFAFSEQLEKHTVADIAERLHTLMEQLGYEHYVVHGGDWGASIGQQMALRYPQSILKLHLTDVPFSNQYSLDKSTLSDAEQDYLNRVARWSQVEGGYYMLLSTKPLTVSYGFADSPVFLAAFMAEKMQSWSENGISWDIIIANTMLYWITNTGHSAVRIYREALGAGNIQRGRVEAPTAIAIFPHDISNPPREYAERFFNVVRFTHPERGGHFAALEEPELFVQDLLEFLAT